MIVRARVALLQVPTGADAGGVTTETPLEATEEPGVTSRPAEAGKAKAEVVEAAEAAAARVEAAEAVAEESKAEGTRLVRRGSEERHTSCMPPA